MTAREYLRSIRQLDRAIAVKQRILDGLERDKGRLSAVRYDADKVHSSTHADPTMVVDKIDQLQREINGMIDCYVDRKREALERIGRVYHRPYADLLTDVYINGLTLEQAAEQRNISHKTVCRWHGMALQIFRRENNMT